MKLLLIFPPQKNYFNLRMPQYSIGEEAGAYPPLGLFSLATSILYKGKHEVKVLDTIAENLDYPQIEKYIEKDAPDVIGITFITEYLRDAVMVAKIAKKVNPEIKIIAGGHHAKLFPVETIRINEIDYVVLGDGEYIINDILDRIQIGKSLDDMEGVVTKTNYQNTKLKMLLVDDLNKLPIIKRDIVDYKKYVSILAKKSPITTMLTSRGCPFRCPYCSGGGIPLRNIMPERVVDELESCVELGIYDILFFDETFTLNRKRAIAICDEIINRSLNIRWHARTRIDCIDKELIKKMKKSGCRLLQFGIETGSQRIQEILNRRFKIEDITEKIKMVKDEGLLTYGNFMFNSPTETIDEMNQTIEFAIKLDLDYAVFGIMCIYPETEIYNQLLKEKKIKEDFWRLFSEDPFSYNIENVYYPGEHNEQILNEILKKSYYKFYIRPKYIFKAIFRDETLYQKFFQIKSGLNVIKNFFK